jgi:hypothetical protein
VVGQGLNPHSLESLRAKGVGTTKPTRPHVLWFYFTSLIQLPRDAAFSIPNIILMGRVCQSQVTGKIYRRREVTHRRRLSLYASRECMLESPSHWSLLSINLFSLIISIIGTHDLWFRLFNISKTYIVLRVGLAVEIVWSRDGCRGLIIWYCFEFRRAWVEAAAGGAHAIDAN